MKTRWLVLIALIAAWAVLTPSVMAGQGKGKAKGKESGQGEFKDKHEDKEKSKAHGQQGALKHQERDKDHDRGWERHDGFESRIYGDRDSRPPGWSRGQKTGWGNCGLPPGQAKKQGACRTYLHQGRRYYYYRDDAGRLVVRRPAVVLR